jgi:hypothetical protein
MRTGPGPVAPPVEIDLRRTRLPYRRLTAGHFAWTCFGAQRRASRVSGLRKQGLIWIQSETGGAGAGLVRAAWSIDGPSAIVGGLIHELT